MHCCEESQSPESPDVEKKHQPSLGADVVEPLVDEYLVRLNRRVIIGLWHCTVHAVHPLEVPEKFQMKSAVEHKHIVHYTR